MHLQIRAKAGAAIHSRFITTDFTRARCIDFGDLIARLMPGLATEQSKAMNS